MGTLGECLVRLRKQKGWTQEVLADEADINLRTLQRLERGECTPRGNTLKQLCDALEVPINQLVEYGKREDRCFLMWFHLSPLAGLVIPLGSVLLPLILWLTKRDQISGLQEQGSNVINFQFSWITLCAIGQIGFILLSIKDGFLSFPSDLVSVLFVSLGLNVLFCLVWPSVAAWRVRKDNPVRLYYPRLISVIR